MNTDPQPFQNITWRVTCSCGKQTTVHFDERRGKYVAADSAWRDNLNHNNWTCGQLSHYQANAVPFENTEP